jgi:hypothetical protein
MDSHPISPIYRLVFNFFEPFMAFAGGMQIWFDAPSYLAIANPNVTYHASLQPLFTSILGGWLIVVFNDLVTLRVFSRDVNVWRCILAAHLISVILYSVTVCQDIGAAQFFNLLNWSKLDWLTIGTTIPPLPLKITFLLGIGVNSDQHATSERKLRSGKKYA